MKHSIHAALVVLSLGAFAAAPARAAEYKVDPSHSNVIFGVRHLVSKVKGSFREFDGTFSFDPKNVKATTGTFVVKAKSIDTDNEKRDEHLKSEDFFYVEKYPELKLENIKLTPKGKGKYTMAGDLTMRGVTKPVKLDLTYNGTAKDPWGNMRAGFTATGKVNRKDFGINWNKTLDAGGVMLSDDVDLELQVEAIQNTPKAEEKAEKAVKEESKEKK